MNFFTEEQYQQLLNNGSPQNRDHDHPPVVKLFLPGTGFTWLINEIDPYRVDMAFGLCDLGMGNPELGYISLTELEELRHPYWDVTVERDMYFEGKYPMSVYAEAAKKLERIVDDERLIESRHSHCLRL